MAQFRFEIKSDNRKTGEKTAAAEHASYIDREGKYKDIDQKRLLEMGFSNVIKGPKLIEHQPGKEVLLYSSPFGIIRQDDEGIKVSAEASQETIAIALMVAQNVYGPNLEFNGTENFKPVIARTANSLELPIVFDENVEEILRQDKEDLLDERRRFLERGGRYIRGEWTDRREMERRRVSARTGLGELTANQPDCDGPTFAEKAKQGFCLPVLSGRNVAVTGSNPDLLLSSDERNDLQRRIRRRIGAAKELRWDVSGTRRSRIQSVTNEIMTKMQNRLGTTFAESHVQYINRDSAFKARGGCLDTGHHLPKWANGSARKFFKAADTWERSNGERYKEIVFSLPNELSLSQQKEILNQFLNEYFGDYYYAYAIHDKIGALSNGEHHPHVHLMFSARQIDDYEREHERPPEQFFKRADAEHPEKYGCGKSEWWNGKDRMKNLTLMREKLAEIENTVLEKYGFIARVDHRSIKERKKAAEENGNMFLAQILDRIPEEALGPVELLNPNGVASRKQRKIREDRQKKIAEAVGKNISQDIFLHEKIDRLTENLTERLSDIQDNISDEIKKLLAREFSQLDILAKKVKALEKASVWTPDAIENAMLGYLPMDERQMWAEFKEEAQEMKNWEKFRVSILLGEIDDQQTKNNLLKEIDATIKTLRYDLKNKAPIIKEIFGKLSFQAKREQIQISAGMLTSETRETKNKIVNILKEQSKVVKIIERKMHLISAERNNTGYTSEEVLGNIGLDLKQLLDKERALKEKITLYEKHKIISPQRAEYMAKDRYTRNGFKNYRQAKAQLEKNAEKMPATEVQAQKAALAKTLESLNQRCELPGGRDKIQEITAGILKKNHPLKVELKVMKAELKEIQLQISELRTLAESAKIQTGVDNNAYRYKTVNIPPPSSFHGSGFIGGTINNFEKKNIEIIAAAFGHNDKFTPLVARTKKDMLDEDWELLSEAEKDEIRNGGRE